MGVVVSFQRAWRASRVVATLAMYAFLLEQRGDEGIQNEYACGMGEGAGGRGEQASSSGRRASKGRSGRTEPRVRFHDLVHEVKARMWAG